MDANRAEVLRPGRRSRQRRIAVMMSSLLALAACSPDEPSRASPVPLDVAPGAVPNHPISEMTARVLQLIAANEAWLGRSLAEPRIIRITYDPDGAEITVRRSDGSVLSDEFRTNAPWVIEVEGTFAWGDHREIGTEQEPVATTPIEALAVRAYVTYPRDSSRSDRDLAELYHFPCWAAGLPPDDEVMDSVGCDPP